MLPQLSHVNSGLDWRKDIVALCLFVTLQQSDSGRTLKDIAAVTGANLKRVWRLQRQWHHLAPLSTAASAAATAEQQIPRPEEILMTKLGYLGLSRQHDAPPLKAAMRNTRGYRGDFSANTIAGTVMSAYLQHCRTGARTCAKKPLKTSQEMPKSKMTSKKMVAQLFQVTPMSLFRYHTYLKRHNIELFPQERSATIESPPPSHNHV